MPLGGQRKRYLRIDRLSRNVSHQDPRGSCHHGTVECIHLCPRLSTWKENNNCVVFVISYVGGGFIVLFAIVAVNRMHHAMCTRTHAAVHVAFM